MLTISRTGLLSAVVSIREP